MSQLSDKALLIYLSINQWSGRKLDKKATATVAHAHSTESEAGNYTKKLLPNAKELDRVNSIAGRIREYFYSQSLPWLSDGGRIIANSNFVSFTAEFRKMKSEFEQAVDQFLSEYPQLMAHAQKSLGGLYDPAEYPDLFQLRKKFKCEINFLPLPSAKDFRIQLSDFERKQFESKMKEVEATAMRDCWGRLFDVVENAANKLSDPKAKFRDSLIENISELCQLLPRLNVTDDPQLELQRQKVESLVKTMKPDQLRGNAIERQDAAAKLAEITKTMGAFMGQGGAK